MVYVHFGLNKNKNIDAPVDAKTLSPDVETSSDVKTPSTKIESSSPESEIIGNSLKISLIKNFQNSKKN